MERSGEKRGISYGVSEFGQLLGRLVERVPGAEAAVLSDRRGDAIDFAHLPNRTRAIDVQIAGAQVGQAMSRLRIASILHGLGQPVVLIECAHAKLVAAPLDNEFLLTLALSEHASLARALVEVRDLRPSLRNLLSCDL
ncbi:MAG: hypothetical protein V3V08_24050 [Nannocystaceae bacterium]